MGPVSEDAESGGARGMDADKLVASAGLKGECIEGPCIENKGIWVGGAEGVVER